MRAHQRKAEEKRTVVEERAVRRGGGRYLPGNMCPVSPPFLFLPSNLEARQRTHYLAGNTPSLTAGWKTQTENKKRRTQDLWSTSAQPWNEREETVGPRLDHSVLLSFLFLIPVSSLKKRRIQPSSKESSSCKRKERPLGWEELSLGTLDLPLGVLPEGAERTDAWVNHRLGDEERRLMHLVPAPAVRLMKSRV